MTSRTITRLQFLSKVFFCLEQGRQTFVKTYADSDVNVTFGTVSLLHLRKLLTYVTVSSNVWRWTCCFTSCYSVSTSKSNFIFRLLSFLALRSGVMNFFFGVLLIKKKLLSVEHCNGVQAKIIHQGGAAAE